MDVFARFLNQSSSVNPLANNASFHYVYRSQLRTVCPARFDPDASTHHRHKATGFLSQIWNGNGDDNALQLITRFSTTGETNHFAFVYIPVLSSLITGNFVFVRYHMFM